MLQPKRTKFRKSHTGNLKGQAMRGSNVSFGDYGLQCLERGHITSRQIEAARMAIQRHVKRAGKLYIRVFPDQPANWVTFDIDKHVATGADPVLETQMRQWAAQ